MRIQELIEILQKTQKERGNIPVVTSYEYREDEWLMCTFKDTFITLNNHLYLDLARLSKDEKGEENEFSN